MKKLIAGLATSGFPFQTAVASAIRGTKSFNVNEEVAWTDENGPTRFLDVVASSTSVRVCVECKALRNERLVFLLPSDTRQSPTGKLKSVLLTRITDGSTRRPVAAYGESQISLTAHESMYCVMVGKDEKGGRIIEHEVQPLVQGTEAYAVDSIRGRRYSEDETVTCIPVLLTTASLYVASYHPTSVSLDNGIYEAHEEELQAVEVIRFTKQFTASGPEPSRRRTVIVAHAKAIQTLFSSLAGTTATVPGSITIFDPASGDGPRRFKYR